MKTKSAPERARNQPRVNLEKVLEHVRRTANRNRHTDDRIILATVDSYNPDAHSGGNGAALCGRLRILFRETYRLRLTPSTLECDRADAVIGKTIWILPGKAGSKIAGVANTIAKAWGFADELPADCIIGQTGAIKFLRWADHQINCMRKKVLSRVLEHRA